MRPESLRAPFGCHLRQFQSDPIRAYWNRGGATSQGSLRLTPAGRDTDASRLDAALDQARDRPPAQGEEQEAQKEAEHGNPSYCTNRSASARRAGQLIPRVR